MSESMILNEKIAGISEKCIGCALSNEFKRLVLTKRSRVFRFIQQITPTDWTHLQEDILNFKKEEKSNAL